MKSKLIYTLFCIVVLDLLGFGIILPILPILLSSAPFDLPEFLGKTAEQREFITYGALVTAYPLFQFLFSPILGQFADLYGRRKILLFCLLGTAASYGLFAYGIYIHNVLVLLIARVIGGIMGGNIAIVQAIAADVTVEKDRAKTFGLLGAGFGIGFILGPFIGGKLSDPTIVSWFSINTPFIFAGLLCLINAGVAWFFVPETLKKIQKGLHLKLTQSIDDIRAAFAIKELHPLFFMGFLFQFAFTMFVSFFGVLLYKRYGFNQGTIGEYFAFAGLWIGLTQLFITGWVTKKFGTHTTVRFALIGCALSATILFFPVTVVILYIVTAVFSVCNGLVQTTILALVSSNSSETTHGKVLGINASIYALAQAVPPALSGFIAASASVETPILIAAILIGINAVFAIILQHRTLRVAVE